MDLLCGHHGHEEGNEMEEAGRHLQEKGQPNTLLNKLLFSFINVKID